VNNLLLFFKEFYKNKGLLVFLSLFVEKLTGFLQVVFIARMISEEDYGLITLIASVFGVFVTLNGLGTTQGLLRYGALKQTTEEKVDFASALFRLGFQKQLILVVFFCVVALFYELKYSSIWLIVCFFAWRLLGFYFYGYIQSFYRITDRNDKFSQLSIITNIGGLILLVVLTFLYGQYGYLIGLSFTPWLCLFFYDKQILTFVKQNIKEVNMKEFWSYSINSSLSYFFSEILFMLDVLIIGLFLKEADIANYKVAIILPMNLMFIPMIFLQTDLPKIISNSKNKAYLKFYVSNYYKIFIPLSLLIIFVGFWIKEEVLSFFFGDKYQGNEWVFFTILIAVCFNMCFRNLYGNLLSAVGLANKNAIISIVSIVLMLGLCLLFVPTYHILGAAMALAITFIVMGFCSGILFYNYLKKL